MTPQAWIVHQGRKVYRIDFLVYYEGRAHAVEVDGHDSHKTKEQRAHDARRDRFLGAKGIQTIRFTGSEIYKDVKRCMIELIDCLTEKKGSEILTE